ncbi:MAG: hypothetical protein GOMPHAMPRED_001587 [Gomphillus americanus]|uniref:NADPH-dependent 1-acyldihydroxyacetone phosphate reductase n=1 Tax=Gomphillus americanus TaxID=1940652 RepID=A0A8H3IM31_9LECA|nr:MAG: hypothetical protein GOMPHAMPRED_001587 [Gomphillus americanus]
MSTQKRTVLITGCSDGGLGAALARAFKDAGFFVYATARNPAKMQSLAALDIETLQLDVQSQESVNSCAARIKQLDVLVNNAGGQFVMPLSDVDIEAAKKIYDLNVWSQIRVIQAFLPLLIASKGMIVNNTSIASVAAVPFQSIYNSSKAAIASVSETLRLEVEPFGVKVIDLRTGVVKSNLINNLKETQHPKLPDGSIYEFAKDTVEKALRQDGFEGQGLDQAVWAKAIVGDLMKKNPPALIWRGESAWLSRIASILPHGLLDGTLKKLVGLDIVEKAIKEGRH